MPIISRTQLSNTAFGGRRCINKNKVSVDYCHSDRVNYRLEERGLFESAGRFKVKAWPGYTIAVTFGGENLLHVSCQHV